SAHLPLLQVAVAARSSLLVSIGVVLTTSIALDAVWSRLARPRSTRAAQPDVPSSAAGRAARRWRGSWRAVGRVSPEMVGAGALAAVAHVPLLPARGISSAEVAVPPLFTTAQARTIPSGSHVLFYPYPFEQDDYSMIWQAESGFRFGLLGGYVLTPLQLHPPGGAGQGGNDTPQTLDPPMLQILLYSANGTSSWPLSSSLEAIFGSKTGLGPLHPAPWATAQIEQDIVKYRVGTIVEDTARFPASAAPGSPVLGEQGYGPDHYPQAATATFTAMFGPPAHVGSLLVWYHADTRPVAAAYR
ncbi:MAG TPA: hypothetical protein VMD59_01050, partial [Acidimicrobiales bacterium]|nr:hypothetical protein [Acidimicrobiales bacterium]